MTEQKKKPLSLNERTNLLLLDLSRSRPRPAKPPHIPPFSNPPEALAPRPSPLPSVSLFSLEDEEKSRKVRLEGRRRLCKASYAESPAKPPEEIGFCLDDDFESPVKEEVRGGDEQIRDILKDLSSRFECLSMEKPRKEAVEPEAAEEFGSASSSLSSDSLCEKGKVREDNEGNPEGLFVEDDGEEEEGGEGESAVVTESVGGTEGRGGVVDVSDDDDVVSILDEGPIQMNGIGSMKSLRYVLPSPIANILYPHQKEGLQWLWSLHCLGTGGILGDDMGLGKTIQISSFLAGLFHSNLIMRVMIVFPKTLLAQWIKELTVVGLSHKIKDYHGTSAKLRNYELDFVLQDGGVLLTTYDIVRNNFKHLRGDFSPHIEREEDEALWDYVILDEGHIIKNPSTQRAKSLLEIPSSHRIIISGTPIQNNLKELWALFNFCCPAVLGSKEDFKGRYEYKILRGNEKVASDREKYIGSTVAKELRERIKPYFLRRLKSEVFVENDAGKTAGLSKKNELIVWLRLTPCQRKMYEAFLNSELVDLAVGGSPLAALTILKKICDHPLLLTKRAAEEVLEGMDAMLNRDDLDVAEKMASNLANVIQSTEASHVENDVSCKIVFILSLLENLVSEGHSILIFSQTRKMLDQIQGAISSKGYFFLRIDGTTKMSEREKTVEKFQDGAAPIFLLTSKVGGLGLTLTRADRVIVADPAWNPSTDNQSVDRAYRIGQKKDVLVYRLMTSGTIEEKIYRMQVFKGGLFKIATEQKDQTRYFSKRDLQELFSVPKQGFDVSLTQQQMSEEHGHLDSMDENFARHISFLEKQGIAGVSDHGLLFSKTAYIPVVPIDTETPDMNHSIPVRTKLSSSSAEIGVNGAAYAFDPKERHHFSRDPINVSPQDGKVTPEEIGEKIKRLSKTLSNGVVVSKLPDRGEKIRKQIAQLNADLIELESSSQKSSEKEPEFYDLDDLTGEFQRGLFV